MSKITIVKNGKKIDVSQKAYDVVYKNSGYTIEEEKKKKSKKQGD